MKKAVWPVFNLKRATASPFSLFNGTLERSSNAGRPFLSGTKMNLCGFRLNGVARAAVIKFRRADHPEFDFATDHFDAAHQAVAMAEVHAWP